MDFAQIGGIVKIFDPINHKFIFQLEEGLSYPGYGHDVILCDLTGDTEERNCCQRTLPWN